MEFYLIVQYYKDQNEERQDEIDACLHYNAKNENITKIYVLVEEGNCNITEFNKKFNYERIDARLFGRLRFDNVFKFANDFIKHESIVAIINNDIILHPKTNWAGCLPHPNLVQCLTRHEIYNQNQARIDALSYQKAWCNDCWIFMNPCRPLNHLEFKVGCDPGCDNAISHRFAEAGYWCINEAHKYITYHIDFAPHRKCIGEIKMCPPVNKIEHRDWCNPNKEGGYFTPITGQWKEHKPPFKLLDILPKLKDHFHSSFFEEYDALKL